MATATKKPATPAKSAAPAAPKKPRAKKTPSMTQAQKFDLLAFVKAADANLPDAAVADTATHQFGRKVLATSVREWRKGFGIASVPKPSIAQLMDYIGTLKAALIGNGVDVPPMAAGAVLVDVSSGGAKVTELQAA